MPIGIGAAMLGSAAIGGFQSLYNTWQQKKTQETTWKREDNAQQRAVKDLKAAGMSPTLAAGKGAPASATQAPQSEAGTNMIENARNALDLFSNRAQISKTEADTRSQLAQARKNEADAALMEHLLPTKKKYGPYMVENESQNLAQKGQLMNNQSVLAMQNYQRLQQQIKWYSDHNLPVSSSLGNYGTVASMLGVDSYAMMIKDINQMIAGALRRLNPFGKK